MQRKVERMTSGAYSTYWLLGLFEYYVDPLLSTLQYLLIMISMNGSPLHRLQLSLNQFVIYPINCHVISLVSSFRKIFTSIFNSRMLKWYCMNDVFWDTPWGFKTKLHVGTTIIMMCFDPYKHNYKHTNVCMYTKLLALPLI